MSAKAVAAFFLSQMLAASIFAQSEFGRVSGGDIDLITKHSQPLSGSLGFTAGFGKGLNATLGGTLVKDRVWFFATGERNEPLFRATDAKMNAQLGDRQNLATSFASQKSAPIPSSFLSLHYTGIVSSNMFVTASFSELRRSNAGN
jgi:hypothetical protein